VHLSPPYRRQGSVPCARRGRSADDERVHPRRHGSVIIVSSSRFYNNAQKLF
jgi:hypothetical protein